MTLAMLNKARRAATEAGSENVEFREGCGDALPVDDGWAEALSRLACLPNALGAYR